MTDREFKERLQKSVDNTLSCLEPSARQCDLIVQNALEGKRVTKKHIPLALVLAILILVFTMSTAVAVNLLWREYAFDVKQIENEIGYYANWSFEDKSHLFQTLIDMGYMEKTSETEKAQDSTIPQEEREQLIDQMMLALTDKRNLREINLDTITYSIFGYSDEWAPETRVWWQQVTNMYREPDADPNTFVVPTENDLPESEAIRIAKEAIIEAYELPADYLDNAKVVADLYITKQHPEYRRWAVMITAHPEADFSSRRHFDATVDCDGNVIADPDIPTFSVWEMAEWYKMRLEVNDNVDPVDTIYQKYLEKMMQNQRYLFCEWPYDVKAAYSAEARLLVLDQIGTEEFIRDKSREIVESTVYAYGIPSETDIQYQEALSLAKKALQVQMSLTEEALEQYSDVFDAYDVTDSDLPLWKFVFINPDDFYGTRYRILLNGSTGEIVLVEAFPWQEGRQSLEYDLLYQ